MLRPRQLRSYATFVCHEIHIKFRQAGPAGQASRLAVQLEGGEVDLALTTPQTGPPGIHARHLFEERYVEIARHDHPELTTGTLPLGILRWAH